MKLILDDPNATWPYDIAVLGFFGIGASLPALSFGRAHQNGVGVPSADDTSDRAKIWLRKMLAIALAVLTAALIVCSLQATCGTIVPADIRVGQAIEPVLLLTILVCSAGYWSLVSRSVLGGIILTAVAQFALYVVLVACVKAIDAMAPGNPYATRISHEPEVHDAFVRFVGAFGLSYAGLMLCLGRKKFVAIRGTSAPVSDMVS